MAWRKWKIENERKLFFNDRKGSRVSWFYKQNKIRKLRRQIVLMKHFTVCIPKRHLLLKKNYKIIFISLEGIPVSMEMKTKISKKIIRKCILLVLRNYFSQKRVFNVYENEIKIEYEIITLPLKFSFV